MRVAIKFAYDGTKYYGFARQPNVITVEGEIIKILHGQGYIQNPRLSKFRYASRTDKGVSALGNVIAFNTFKPIDNILEEININSDELVFYGIKQVESSFYPRYAKQRIYRYYLKNKNINFEKIDLVSSIFIGTHNFKNFARLEDLKNPIRTIDDIKITQQPNWIIIDFFAQNFLWHQIRRMLSAIDKVQEEKLQENHIRTALEHPQQKVDFGISPAKYLILKDVKYNFDFMYTNDNLRKVHILEKHIISHLNIPFTKKPKRQTQRHNHPDQK